MAYVAAKTSKLYPNGDTKVILNKTMGSCRFVWNQLLGKHQEAYGCWLVNNNRPKPDVNIVYFNRELSKLKEEFPWLYEVSATALQQTILNLSSAFVNFFVGKCAYPRFKSRKQNGSFRITGSISSIIFKDGKVKIPKTKRFTVCRPSIEQEERISSYTVTKDRTGDFFISPIFMKQSIPNPPTQTGMVGIDLGIKSLAVVKPLHGEPWELQNPRTYIKYQRKRTQLARRLAKKQKGSNNRNKARIKLAKLERKVANIRKDHLHKFTTKLVNENQVINLEDLNVAGMVKNPKLAKHIADCGFGTIRRMLEYKANRFKRPVTIGLVNRFYPSSQLCSNCGIKSEVKLTLKVRVWNCSHCGIVHDRDINAATNILFEGLRVVS